MATILTVLKVIGLLGLGLYLAIGLLVAVGFIVMVIKAKEVDILMVVVAVAAVIFWLPLAMAAGFYDKDDAYTES